MKKTAYTLAAILAITLVLGAYFLITNSHTKAYKIDMAATKEDSTGAILRETEAVQAQMQVEIADLKSRLAVSEQARDAMAKTLEDKVAQMAGDKNTLEKQIENGKAREAELETQKASLETQIDKLNVELNETQTQFTALKENPVNEPPINPKALKRELLIQEKKLARVTGLYDRLKDELKGFAGVIDRKDETLASKNREIESLRARIDELEKNQAILNKKNDPEKIRATELKKRVEVILQTTK